MRGKVQPSCDLSMCWLVVSEMLPWLQLAIVILIPQRLGVKKLAKAQKKEKLGLSAIWMITQ